MSKTEQLYARTIEGCRKLTDAEARDIPNPCRECNGTGKVKKYPNNPGSGFTVPCLRCAATEARND